MKLCTCEDSDTLLATLQMASTRSREGLHHLAQSENHCLLESCVGCSANKLGYGAMLLPCHRYTVAMS